ncbi:MAG: hypothetical protein WCN97_06140 [Thermoleophilia bacterium]|jgi:hypothetical protein
MTSRRFGRHDWLGLTPEVERFGPLLVERIAGALGESHDALGEARVEGLIRDGDAAAWLAYLAALTALVDRGAASGVAEAETEILAEILRDQYRLAPGVLVLSEADMARSQHLEALLETR